MSVPLYDRTKAQTQFLDDAKTLTKEIFAWAKNQSKRSFDILAKDLMTYAGDILFYAWKGNTTKLIPDNYQDRTDSFNMAIDNIRNFRKQLTIIYFAELNPVTDGQYQRWIELTFSIHKQLTNIKKSDNRRIKLQKQ